MGIPTQINNSYRRCFFGRNLTPTQNTSDLFAGFTEIASGADFKWNKNARNKSFLYPVTNGALWAAGISQSLESGVEEKELMTVKVTPLSTFFFPNCLQLQHLYCPMEPKMHAFFLCFFFRNHVRYIQPCLSCRRQSLSLTKGRLLWNSGLL